MGAIRNFILGSAAGLLAVGGAQAADLPVKAKAIEYVRVCSLYGAGFWYIPATDTCMKIGGYLRADTTFDGGGAHGRRRSCELTTRTRVVAKVAIEEDVIPQRRATTGTQSRVSRVRQGLHAHRGVGNAIGQRGNFLFR
jgi:hypothetical protein